LRRRLAMRCICAGLSRRPGLLRSASLRTWWTSRFTVYATAGHLFRKKQQRQNDTLRLPILIAASLTNSDQIYALSVHGLTFGLSFTDIANTTDPHLSLTLGLQWLTRKRLVVTLQHVASQQDSDSVQPSFIQVDGTRRNIKLTPKRTETFRDLVDSQLPPAVQHRLDDHIMTLRDLLRDLIHIPSFRHTHLSRR